MPTPDQYITAELSRLAWQEGKSESHNLMVALMLVQANRVRAEWCGGNWLAVFDEQRETFSGWLEKYRSIGYRDPEDIRDPKFQAVLADADLVYAGGEDALTDGALYYAALGSPFYDLDGFFQHQVVQKPNDHPRIATIGNYTFFR